MGLPPVLILCVSAMVVYKVNTWVSRAVYHGLTAEVIDIVYHPGKKPIGAPGPGEESDLPRVIFLKADGYKGPSYLHPDLSEAERLRCKHEGIFPVFPVERKWDAKVQTGKGTKLVSCTRRMFPLELGWARTIHKSQGMNIGPTKAWGYVLLDIGSTELWICIPML